MKSDAILVRRAVAPLGAQYRDALIPADGQAAERVAQVPLGEPVAIRFVGARSSPQNRLYWGILNHVAESSAWESAETLHECLKVRLGYFSTGKTPGGKLVVIPKSTAFEAMPHEEFCEYMDKAIKVICAEVLGGYEQERLVREVEAMLGLPPLPPAPRHAPGGETENG